MNYKPEEVARAYKDYLEGNRAPWVERTLAAAYRNAKAALEAEELKRADWNVAFEDLEKKLEEAQAESKRWCDIAGELAQQKEELQAMIKEEAERADKWRTEWAESQGELRHIEEHPDGLQSKLTALEFRHCLICLDKCLHTKSEIKEALSPQRGGGL